MQLATVNGNKAHCPGITVIASWMNGVRGTILLTAAMFVANCDLLMNNASWSRPLLTVLQYDRDAILHGEVWRLMTGNLVHWSAEHFWLDVGAFLLLGALYEPSFKRGALSFVAFLSAVAFVIGASLLLFLPELHVYRGLSGVDSGIFAAALLIEAWQAKENARRWFFVGPAALIFTAKLAFECATGELFFGTSSLGDLGQPVPLAHVAGAFAALAALGWQSRWRFAP
jgi:rhomboid family GlyGly-CTERM serine protease